MDFWTVAADNWAFARSSSRPLLMAGSAPAGSCCCYCVLDVRPVRRASSSPGPIVASNMVRLHLVGLLWAHGPAPDKEEARNGWDELQGARFLHGVASIIGSVGR